MSETEPVSLLDSCGVGHLGSHLMIAGVGAVNVVEAQGHSAEDSLNELVTLLTGDKPTIFTLSYDFGRSVLGIDTRHAANEPDACISQFDSLIVHDYSSGETFQIGREIDIDGATEACPHFVSGETPDVRSNFTKQDYLDAIDRIKELIRRGDTYQTNLTQQLSGELPSDLTAQEIFWRLREQNPAPFAAFITRSDSTVISASPERFFRIADGRIITSPIKGTRPRGNTPGEDADLREELLTSEKDRAENTMIVDLLRNDLGRVCEYGSVKVDSLCELEEHPTYRHLVSTVSGKLREDTTIGEIIRAVFPCGSITGAPKISAMRIIDELEPHVRGLSMGAIGYYLPPGKEWQAARVVGVADYDLSVAIRTMVVRNGIATFNVGGGITIDSDPKAEYEESLLKAKALLDAVNVGGLS